MPGPRDPQTLVEAARLYYLENRSQQEVASELGTSRPNVSRMLADALAQGIVEIRINDPAGRERSSRTQLKRPVRPARRPGRAARRPGAPDRSPIASAACRRSTCSSRSREDMTVALSWGHALQAMVWTTTADRESRTPGPARRRTVLDHERDQRPELVRELAARLGA